MSSRGARATRGSSPAAWLIRGLLVACLLALAAPALAAAQTAETAVEPPAATAPLDAQPAGDEAVSEQAAATEAPAPVDQSGTVPAEPPAATAEPAPAPAPVEPAAAPAPAEASPGPSAGHTTLLDLPEPSRPRAADVALGPVVIDAGHAAPAAAPAGAAPGGPAALAAADLGAPARPSVPGGAARADQAPAAAAPPDAPRVAPTLFDRAAPAPGPASRAPLASEDGARPSGPNPFAELAAAMPMPSGSSVLAVLAAYVMPGGGTLPASTLLLLVQLAVMLAALLAFRPELRERVLALGRAALPPGHHRVLPRPG